MTIPSSDVFFSGGSCLPCTPEEEKRIVDELEASAVSNRKEGDLYYIVSGRWWRVWQNYVGSNMPSEPSTILNNENPHNIPSRPGQIDNTELIDHETEGDSNQLLIKKDLMEGQDYILVPEEVWKRLIEWYKGGPTLPRNLISSQGIRAKNWIVEVHPISLKLVDARDNSQKRIAISRKESFGDLYNIISLLLKLDRSKFCVWDHFENKKQKILNDDNQTIYDALVMDQEILVEMKPVGYFASGSGLDSTGNSLALVATEPSKSSFTIAGGPALSNGLSTNSGHDLIQGNNLFISDKCSDNGKFSLNNNSTKVDDRGLTGLHNLGNTCFMNSAIQCLVHTPPLVEYFLGDYGSEINKENPLGMNGELVVAFGDLLRKLWSSERTPIAPRAFKSKLALFAPQFSGYNQHDSQELLAFLLDGLHEDLNRVKRKPYIEAKDWDGQTDNEFAKECWENHKARNDSIIVDTCQGQYKSTLVCPVCSKISVTFDPFMYLSLPLPSSSIRSMNVTVFRGDGSALPIPLLVTVPKHGCCQDLTQALSVMYRLGNDEAILLAEVYENQIFKYFENPSELLVNIKDEECIVAYILPKNHQKLRRLVLMHEKNTDEKNSNKLIGVPLVTCLAEGNYDRVRCQVSVATLLKPLMRTGMTKCNKEIDSNFADTLLGDGNPCPMEEDPATSNEELEDNGLHYFNISVTDEKAVSRNSLDSDAIKSNPLRLVLEWSKTQNDLYDFSYLENLPEVCKSGFSQKKIRQDSISLFSCLDAFLKEEPLGPDDMWYCPRCKQHRQATKKLDLWMLPDIVVIHLKRFSYSRYLKNKLDTFVSFPIHNLDLSKYLPACGQSSVYELYAMSNHYGGFGGGHYSAYAKLVNDNSWYHFDDSHVSPVSEESIRTSAAYVLFYRRVNHVSKLNGLGE